jgi:hypothetical protein
MGEASPAFDARVQDARVRSRAVARWLPVAVVALLVLDATVLAVLVPAALAPTAGQDFQWWGTHALLGGRDPYRLFLDGHCCVLVQIPNYLHLLYFLLTPLGALPLATARAVWLGANVVMLGGAALLVGRRAGLRGWPLAAFAALLPCSQPFVNCLINGQQTGLVLLAAVLATWARSDLAAGAAWAVLLTKYSFAPVAFAAPLARRWRQVAVLSFVTVAALAAFCVVTGTAPWAALAEPLRVNRAMARGAGDVMTLASVHGVDRSSVACYALAAVVAAGLTWAGRRLLAGPERLAALACGSLVSLMVFPHLLYDYCLLLPVLAVGLRREGWRRVAIVVPVVALWHGAWLTAGWLRPYSPAAVTLTLALLAVAFTALVAPVRDR